MKNTAIIFLAVLLGGIFLLSFTDSNMTADPEPWIVPAEYENLKNPVAADDESLEVGEDLYKQHCKSCHGAEGLGDGTKADELDTPCGDFSSEEFQSQSDGAMFYKSHIGRDEMPNFEKKIPDEEDVWHLVNYMKTLGE